MSGSTANQGYPYPGTPDFADVQDAYRLATAVDADLRAAQAPFRSFLGRPSFIVRQAANGSGFTTGGAILSHTTVDWDNTGGITLGGSLWNQPTAQEPSWWMLGATILTVNTAGVPVVGDLVMGSIEIDTTDQVSGLSTEIKRYQRDDETNTNGQWVNVFTQAAIYRATVSARLTLNGSSSKAIAAGSTFWGLYLGPVV